MKQYFVIHSEDPYLLARLCTELQMEGMKVYAGVNLDQDNPFSKYEMKWLEIKNGLLEFYNYNTSSVDKDLFSVTLTSRNYLSVLTKIIEQ